jgi:hypothetical protein
MAGNLVDIIVTAQDNASKKLDKINRSLGNMSKTGGKVAGILAGVSGSIASLAPAVAGIGALGASFASAGVGAVAFGAVAQSAIGKVVDASSQVAKIEQQIKNADSTQERIQAQKELANVMGGLNSAEQGALKSMMNFKTWWQGFVQTLEKPVFGVFNQGLTLIKNTMTALQPAISAVGTVLGGFLEKVNASFKTDKVQGFFNMINTMAGSSLQAVLTSAGNLFSGFMSILQAFAPLSDTVNNGLVNMTASFAKWASGLASSKGFQQFIEYAKTNAPMVISTIQNLASFIGRVVVALAPLGQAVLSLASSFASWLNQSTLVNGALSVLQATGNFLKDNLTAVQNVLLGLGVAVGSFVTIMKGMEIVGVITKLFQAWRAGTIAETVAQWGLNTAMLSNPLTWIAVAIAAVIAVGVLLWKNWDTIKAKTQELWSKMTKVWSQIKSTISSAVHNMISTVISFGSNLVSQFMSMWNRGRSAVSNGVHNIISTIKNIFHGFSWSSIGSFIIKGIAKGIGSMTSWIKNKVADVAGGMLSVAKHALGIHSPSRVFANEVGKFIPMGIGVGIEKNAHHALNALDSMKSQMLDSMSGLDSSVGLGYFSGGNTVRVVHEVQGSVQVSGDNGKAEVLKIAKETVGTQFIKDDFLSGLKQAVRKR